MSSRVLTASIVAEPHARLISIIHEFCHAADLAVKGLQSFAGAPDLLHAWRSGKIKQSGTLADPQARYQFHGIGCEFEMAGRVVDVDFGPNGRHDGFDAWRLWQYCKSGSTKQRLSLKIIEQGLSALEEAGIVVKSKWENAPHLLYLSNSVKR